MAELHLNVFLLLSPKMLVCSVVNEQWCKQVNTMIKVKVSLDALTATQENNGAIAILILKV